MGKYVVIFFSIAFFFGFVELVYLTHLIKKAVKERPIISVEEKYEFGKIDSFVFSNTYGRKSDKLVNDTVNASLHQDGYNSRGSYKIDVLCTKVA